MKFLNDIAASVLLSYALSLAVSTVHAEPIAQSTQLMGKKLTVSQDSKATLSQQGITTETQVQFLGKQRSLLQSTIEMVLPVAGSVLSAPDSSVTPISAPAENSIPIARTDLYIGGTRVWNGSLRVEQGGLVYSGGVAPTQVPFPILVYPIGPLVLQVDAGIEFEGKAEASILPGISIPIEDMTIDAKLEAELYAAGYIEGYAKLLFVRGGIGGAVNFIEGSSGVGANIFFNGSPARTYGFGKVSLLSGKVYAFVDSKFLFGSWKRWYSKNLFKYPGKCFSFGEVTCASQ